MPRSLFIRSDTHPYHVTGRCNNKKEFPIPLGAVWKIMQGQLAQEKEDHKLDVIAFVLMPNHFHLLCQTPNANLDVIMHRFLRQTSIKINSQSRIINHLWGGPYKWSLIDTERYYREAYRYIYQNPVRAGICKRVEDYAFSDLKLKGPSKEELTWLNTPYETRAKELMRLGLRKAQFSIAKRSEKDFP